MVILLVGDYNRFDTPFLIHSDCYSPVIDVYLLSITSVHHMNVYWRIVTYCFVICLSAVLVIGISSAEQNAGSSEKQQVHGPDNSDKAVGTNLSDAKGPGQMHPQNGTPGSGGHPPDFANNSELKEKLLSDLSAKGVDTTELRTAIENGDKEKIRQLMDSFRDKMPAAPQNGTPGARPDGNEQGRDKGASDMPGDNGKTPSKDAILASETSEPVASPTKSPLSPLTILAGLGVAGLAICIHKRE